MILWLLPFKFVATDEKSCCYFIQHFSLLPRHTIRSGLAAGKCETNIPKSHAITCNLHMNRWIVCTGHSIAHKIHVSSNVMTVWNVQAVFCAWHVHAFSKHMFVRVGCSWDFSLISKKKKWRGWRFQFLWLSSILMWSTAVWNIGKYPIIPI